MARMIPPQYDESTRSTAERRLFDRLRTDPETESWIALHSLGLSGHAGKPYGEIDFVVIVPGGGIVCLEVKGGGVACTNGVWSTTDRFGKTYLMNRSPFMQAREGMFALRESLESRFGKQDDVMRCTFAYAVVLPDVDSPPDTIEYEPWEIIDRTAFQRPVSHLIRRILRDQQRKLNSRVDPTLPNVEIVSKIRQHLRPDFEVVVTRSTQILQIEKKLIQLTEQQYDVLDRLQENPRCLIKGAAGTGKTLLAVEYAKRSAQQGAKVLLICYNRLLGDWLAEQTRELKRVTAGTFHSCLRSVILSSSFAAEFRKEEQQKIKGGKFFDEVFPVFAELAAAELDIPYDIIIIDEAQDLLHVPALNVLNTLLRGGLAGGQWTFLGDFTQQAIFSSPAGLEEDVLDNYCPYYTRERLTINCRNTRQIAQETLLLSGFPSPPFRLSKVEGIPVSYSYWRNAQSQRQKLEQAIASYLKDGLNPNDILLLSPVVFERSVASEWNTSEYHVQDVRQLSATNENKQSILFATVQAFKGLESPVVILCDVNSIDDREPQSLLYVGMSRARSHLTVLLHENVRVSVSKLTTRKLLES